MSSVKAYDSPAFVSNSINPFSNIKQHNYGRTIYRNNKEK